MLHQLSPFEVGYIDRSPNRLLIAGAVFLIALVLVLPALWWMGRDSLKKGVSSDVNFYFHHNITDKTRPVVQRGLAGLGASLPDGVREIAFVATSGGESVNWFVVSRASLSNASISAGKYFYTPLGPGQPNFINEHFSRLSQAGALSKKSIRPWIWFYRGDYGLFDHVFSSRLSGLPGQLVKDKGYFRVSYSSDNVSARLLPSDWRLKDFFRIWGRESLGANYFPQNGLGDAGPLSDVYLTSHAVTLEWLFELATGKKFEELGPLNDDRNWVSLQSWLSQARASVFSNGQGGWAIRADSSREISSDTLLSGLRGLLAESWPSMRSRSLPDGTLLREFLADRDRYNWEPLSEGAQLYKLSIPVLGQPIFLLVQSRYFGFSNNEAMIKALDVSSVGVPVGFVKCPDISLKGARQAYSFMLDEQISGILGLGQALLIDKSGYVDICTTKVVDK